MNKTAGNDDARRRLLLRIALVAVAFGALLLASCSSNLPQSSLNPRSTEAESIDQLWDFILVLGTVVFVVVGGALAYAVVRFRKRPGNEEEPRQIHGNTKLEIGWTLIPVVLVVIIAVPTLTTLFDLRSAAEGDFVRVDVIGHQWWWEFQYPDILDENGRPLTTANEMHIPAGKTSELTMTSVDVIHSFWVPSLAGKRDVVPGRDTVMKITPDADIAGQMVPGQCAEYCGLAHADMRFRVFVDSEADFDAWAAGQLEAAPIPTSGEAAAGYETFTQFCTTCHQAKVAASDGTVEVVGAALGPDLTHFGGRTSIAAGLEENTAEHLAAWIDDPSSIKPMTPELNDIEAGRILGMPDYGLDEQQIQELVALLEAWK
ncbi:MAG: cytochrome c oxidase subunit II [Acidimicrobiia bacterium]